MTEQTLQTIITAGAGLIGVAIGSWIAVLVANNTNKVQRALASENQLKEERAQLDGMIIKMIELAIEYPYLERQDFSLAYPNCVGHTHGKERYENYCCFVFNMIEMMFTHFEENPQKIESYFHVREAIRKHYKWWLHDQDNLEYSPKMRNYVQSLIDELRKSGVIRP